MSKSKFSSGRKTLYGLFIVTLLWCILYFAVDSAAIPSPYKTLINFVKIFPGTLSRHLFVSLGRILWAISLSLIIGTALGIFIGVNSWAEELISPIIYILYPLPKIAFLPILMILFGLGNTPKILLIVFIIVFQFILASRDGVKEIPKELIYSVNSLGLSKLQFYRHLIIPALLPKIITSLRNSIGISISVLFFSENFATTYGIGYFIMNSFAMVNYVEMFSGIMALSLLGLILFKLIDILEMKLCPWIKISREHMVSGSEA